MYYKKLLLAIAMLFAITANSQNWNQTMKHIASIRSNTGNYGFAVAIDGNFAVISAISEATDAFGTNLLSNAGAAYILQNINGAWVEIKKIVAPDRAAADNFGNTVSISGNVVVIGASSEDEDALGNVTLQNAGSAYIFGKDVGGTNNWGFLKKLVALDRASSDYFGQSVSVNGDNIIVGAYAEAEDANGLNSAIFAGSAYVFNKDAGGVNNWGQVKKIVASDRAAVDQFGYSVSINGNIAVVGAFQEDQDADGLNTLSNSGSVYVFYKDAGGVNNWGQVKKVVALDRGAGDFFGNAISIQGNNVVVGAFQEDHDLLGASTQNNSGSAYVFNKDQGGVDNWGQVKKLIASDRFANDFFARSVSISGNSIIVGAIQEDEDINGNNTLVNSGSAYIFSKDLGGVNNWGQARKITASDRGDNDYFGISVAVNNDLALVGSFQEDEDVATVNTITDAGAAYAFKGGCINFPLTTTFTTAIGNQQIIKTDYYNNNCSLIVSVAQQGALPINAHVTTKVWIDGIQNPKYIMRHVEINPATNPTTTTGRITLYCTQAEINNFNAISPYDLPTNAADVQGISYVRVRKYTGTSNNGTGNPATYSGSSVVIDPVDADIIWNATDNRWEISFNDVGFGGYFVEAPPPTIITTSAITPFTTCAGTPSTNQSFTVNASFLISPLTITAPTGFEVSILPNTGYNSSIIVTPINGAITTTIYVRLNSVTSSTPSGNINLTATDANTATIAVTGVANPASKITLQPTNSTICFGNSAAFNLTATGVNVTYQWQILFGNSFTNIVGANTATLAIPTPPSNGNYNGSQYRCIVSSVCAPDTSNIVTLNILPTTTLTLSATALQIKPGQTTLLTATSNISGGVITWYKNDNPTPLATGATYGPVNIAQIGSYKVTYTSPATCFATSYPIVISGLFSNELTVYPSPNNGKFSFRYFNQTNDAGKIVVYNLSGKKLYQATFSSGTTYSENKVNISNQPNGIYIIAVTDKYGEILYKRPIVIAR